MIMIMIRAFFQKVNKLRKIPINQWIDVNMSIDDAHDVYMPLIIFYLLFGYTPGNCETRIPSSFSDDLVCRNRKNRFKWQ